MRKASRQALEITRFIAEFLRSYAPLHKTASANTLKSYRDALALYIEFLEAAEGVDATTLCANHFSRPRIERWLQWLRDKRGSSPSTCNCRLGALRAFLEYLSSRSPEMLHLSQDASNIPRMKAAKKKVCGISRQAIKALLSCPDTGRAGGIRDLALMIFLYSSAARIDEVLSLKIGQLHLQNDRPYAHIVGKGGRVRTLYLPHKAACHIKAYINIFHGDSPDQDAYLFYSRNKGPHGKLSQQAVAKMLKKHAAKAHCVCKDVPMGLHAHQFRHARASHWLEDGMNVVQISFLLGHESLETTMCYLDITLDEEYTALSALEDDGKKPAAKWKYSDGSLRSFCGLE